MTQKNTDVIQPIFQKIFGGNWEQLPIVMKNHYAIRPNSDDKVTVEGHLDINMSPMVSVMAKLTGMLLAYSGKDVPVTVVFTGGRDEKSFNFDRIFHFPKKGDVKFRSCMEHIKDNVLVEFMRFGVGWKLAYEWDGNKVILAHRGYVWRIFGVSIPVPLEWIIGKGYAEEIPISDDSFSMWTHSKHFLFGNTFGYAGKFKITEVTCDQS